MKTVSQHIHTKIDLKKKSISADKKASLEKINPKKKCHFIELEIHYVCP